MGQMTFERTVNVDLATTANKPSLFARAVPLAASGFTAISGQIYITGADPLTAGKIYLTGSNDGVSFIRLNRGNNSVFPFQVEISDDALSFFVFAGSADGASSIQYINMELENGVGPGVITRVLLSCAIK